MAFRSTSPQFGNLLNVHAPSAHAGTHVHPPHLQQHTQRLPPIAALLNTLPPPPQLQMSAPAAGASSGGVSGLAGSVPVASQQNYYHSNTASGDIITPIAGAIPSYQDVYALPPIPSQLQPQPLLRQQQQQQQHLQPQQPQLTQPQLGATPAQELYTASGNMRKHLCKVCGKGFTTSGHLARHNRIHTGVKNHTCSYPGCGAKFSRHDNCMQHYKTHLKVKKGSTKSSKLGY